MSKLFFLGPLCTAIGPAIACGAIAACAAGETHGVDEGEPRSGGSASIGGAGGAGIGGASTGGSAPGGVASGGGGSGGLSVNPIPNAPTGGAGGAGCAAIRTRAESAAGDIYIMQDSSGSMLENGKWTAIEQAITGFVNTPGLDGLGVGLAFFGRPPDPTGPCGNCTALDCMQRCGCTSTTCTNNVCGCLAFDNSCDSSDYESPSVEISPLPGAAGAIVAAYRAVTPFGSTPSHPALDGAIRHARAWMDTTHRRTVVVFATDGEPTECDPATNTVQGCSALAAAGAAQGILTFVIGVGSSLRSLDAIAAAGGTNEAFIVDASGGVTTTRQFTDALKQIQTSTALACAYDLPPPPPGQVLDPRKVNVDYTSGTPAVTLTLPNVIDKSGCRSEPGWYYDDPARPARILMCDATCAELSSNAANRKLDILLGCATVVRPIM